MPTSKSCDKKLGHIMYLSTSILTVIFQDAVQTGSAEVGVVTSIYITFNTTEFELRFYVRTDTKYVISETFFLSTQLCMHQRMVCATQFNSYCTKLSTSFLLSYDPDRPELNLIGYKIQESTAAWIWVVSQQNWRNQAATGWTLEKH